MDLQPGCCPHVHVIIFTEIRKYCASLGGHYCNTEAALTCTCSVAKLKTASHAARSNAQEQLSAGAATVQTHRSLSAAEILGISLRVDPRGRCFQAGFVPVNFASSQLSTVHGTKSKYYFWEATFQIARVQSWKHAVLNTISGKYTVWESSRYKTCSEKTNKYLNS